VLRGKNAEADRLANEAMDKGMGRASVSVAPARLPEEFEGIVQNGEIRLTNGELPEGTRVQVRVKK
jgi:probable phosphoglycerate mutase